MNTRKVILQFPDLKSLLDYSITIELVKCEVVRSRFILICELTTKEIELAINGYNAKLIEEESNSKFEI